MICNIWSLSDLKSLSQILHLKPWLAKSCCSSICSISLCLTIVDYNRVFWSLAIFLQKFPPKTFTINFLSLYECWSHVFSNYPFGWKTFRNTNIWMNFQQLQHLATYVHFSCVAQGYIFFHKISGKFHTESFWYSNAALWNVF